jgi:hypothetical protein
MATIASGDAASLEAPHRISPWRRAVLVFTRPSQAWEGLKEHPQWWFPMLVMILVSILVSIVLYDRAIVPMVIEGWERQVANEQMTSQQLDQMVQFMESPVGKVVSVAQQVIGVPIILFFTALLMWFGVGFVLGTGMKYRLALEVAAWSSLITIVASLLTVGLAWQRQTMRGVHVGFGILLPEVDPPTKLSVALGTLLDWVSPLYIWYLVVAILGASALSGAPRKSVAWTLGILYLVIGVFVAGLAALFTPA